MSKFAELSRRSGNFYRENASTIHHVLHLSTALIGFRGGRLGMAGLALAVVNTAASVQRSSGSAVLQHAPGWRASTLSDVAILLLWRCIQNTRSAWRHDETAPYAICTNFASWSGFNVARGGTTVAEHRLVWADSNDDPACIFVAPDATTDERHLLVPSSMSTEDECALVKRIVDESGSLADARVAAYASALDGTYSPMPEVLQALDRHVRVRRVVAVDGHPGSGKTLSVAYWCRVNQLRPIFITRMYELLEEIQQHVDRITNTPHGDPLADAYPDVLVLDDFDRWGDNEAATRTVLDKLHTLDIRVIATTNNIEATAPTIRRPKRIDRIIKLEHAGESAARAMAGDLYRAELADWPIAYVERYLSTVRDLDYDKDEAFAAELETLELDRELHRREIEQKRQRLYEPPRSGANDGT